MNPLTLVKRIQKLNSTEADLGISESASWHAKYKDSAYVYVGGVPYDLTEGDLLAVFAQYGEIVDVNLVRDKSTGKSKGFAFIAYEDQRSTNLAVDNFNGAQVLGRIIRVDHVRDYKKKEEEDEETARQKREERGVCRQFQKGECTRGDGCKFSHDEQRAANTGWGQEEDRRAKWAHDNFEGNRRTEKQPDNFPSNMNPKHGVPERRKFEDGESRKKDRTDRYPKRDDDFKPPDHRARSRQEPPKDRKVDREHRDSMKSSGREDESHSREDYHGKEYKRARKHTEESDMRDDRDRMRERERDTRPSHARDSSSARHRDEKDYHLSRR